MPYLTVLMPVKDGMPYLRLAILSTLRAMPRDSELLVLDDASQDTTFAFLEGVDDPRLRVIRSDKSRGVTASLNRLLVESDSAYVARMDADDVCLPWRFKMQAHYARKADIVFSSIYSINEANFPIRPDLPGRISPEALPFHLLVGNCVVHPTMYAARAVIAELGNYHDASAEDYELWLRAASAGRTILRTAEPALLYRRHPNQISAAGGWLKQDDVLDHTFGQAARQLTGFAGDTSTIRRAGARRAYQELDPILRTSFAASIRSSAKSLPFAQRALLNARLKVSRLG